MKKGFKIIWSVCSCLVMAHSIEVSGQKSYQNEQRIETNANQQYVNKKTQGLPDKSNPHFQSGFVIRASDTIQCDIYLPGDKLDNDMYLFILAKYLRDSIVILTASDIAGYSVHGITMMSHKSGSDYFFIREIERGRVTLYDRPPIPSDYEYLYYFRKAEDRDLFFLAPNARNYTYVAEKYKDGGIISRYNTQNESQFEAVFMEYVKDCTAVSNKIKAKFYTINDLEAIIREYNKCGRSGH